jgi:serine/threonine protein kinase
MDIYENESLKIIQDKNNKTMYKIIFNYKDDNSILIRSLIKTRLIQGGTVTDDYNMMQFKAQSVVSFQKFIEQQNRIKGGLNINLAAKMVADLTRQLEYLISKEYVTIIGYKPENIIVIDGCIFAFLGSDLLVDLDSERITITFPFKVTDFFASPEMLKIRVLPSYIHYKTSYFSLGCLLLYAFNGNDDFYKEYIIDGNCTKIKECLNQLHFKNTKLYWLLSRCLVEDPEKRNILFI